MERKAGRAKEKSDKRISLPGVRQEGRKEREGEREGHKSVDGGKRSLTGC